MNALVKIETMFPRIVDLRGDNTLESYKKTIEYEYICKTLKADLKEQNQHMQDHFMEAVEANGSRLPYIREQAPLAHSVSVLARYILTMESNEEVKREFEFSVKLEAPAPRQSTLGECHIL